MEKKTSGQAEKAKKILKIVDLFAGPGGLGEGFSSHPSFKIVVSAEMESSAHATLRLRAFYWNLKRMGMSASAPYFELCNGEHPMPTNRGGLPHWDDQTRQAWEGACEEALRLTLGEEASN